MFKNGDTVCFFGDSITAQGKFIQRVYNYYLKTLGIKLRMYNFGVLGDCAKNAIKRIEMILNKKPSHVVMMFGMNDVERDLYSPLLTDGVTDDIIAKRRGAIDCCVEYQKQIADIFISHGAKVIFCRPTLYDEERDIECENRVDVAHALYEIGERLESAAKIYDADVINYSQPFLIAQRNAIHKGATLINDDRVHPNELGHMAMAKIFLSQQEANIDSNLDIEALREFSNADYSIDELRKLETELLLNSVNFIEYCVFINSSVAENEKDDLLKKINLPEIAGYIQTYYEQRDNRRKLEEEIEDIVTRLSSDKK